MPEHLVHLRILWTQRQFIVVFSLSAALTALAITYGISERYQGGVALFYRHLQITVMKPSEQLAFGSPAPNAPFKVISKTLQEYVESEALLKPIVFDFNLHVDEKIYEGPWYKQFYERTKDFVLEWRSKIASILKYGEILEEDPVFSAVKELRKNIEIVNEDSFVFLILVRDSHPKRAAFLADAVGERLEEMLRVQNVAPAKLRFAQIDALFQDKRAAFDAIQTEIEKLLDQHQVASVDQEISRGMERYSDLSLDEARLRADLVKGRERVGAIRAMLGGERLADGGRGSSIQYIHPDDKRRFESELLAVSVELEGDEARLQSLLEEITSLRARLQTMNSVRLRLEQLRVELEGVKRDMVQLRDAREEAAVRSETRASEVVLLHKSSIPNVPKSPVKLYHVGLALGTATFVSIALIYVFQFFNVRLFFRSLGPEGRRYPPRADGAGVDERRGGNG